MVEQQVVWKGAPQVDEKEEMMVVKKAQHWVIGKVGSTVLATVEQLGARMAENMVGKKDGSTDTQ